MKSIVFLLEIIENTSVCSKRNFYANVSPELWNPSGLRLRPEGSLIGGDLYSKTDRADFDSGSLRSRSGLWMVIFSPGGSQERLKIQGGIHY